MVIPSLLSRYICLIIGCIYPGYASFKAIKEESPASIRSWLMYWIVYCGFSFFFYFSDSLLFWFPFYEELKIIITLWLVLPYTEGSQVIYKKYFHPFIEDNESQIDSSIRSFLDVSQKTGASMLRKTFRYCGQKVLAGVVYLHEVIEREMSLTRSEKNVPETSSSHPNGSTPSSLNTKMPPASPWQKMKRYLDAILENANKDSIENPQASCVNPKIHSPIIAKPTLEQFSNTNASLGDTSKSRNLSKSSFSLEDNLHGSSGLSSSSDLKTAENINPRRESPFFEEIGNL